MKSPRFFKNAAAFRTWLERYGASEKELLVGYWKVDSGRPSMSWSDSVDEALCFGWIDGIRRRIDDQSYSIRFTPRNKDSIWSAINLAKVEMLTTQGRMRPAGLEAHARRSDDRSRIYTYERQQTLELSPEELRQLKRNAAAWRYFEAAPPGYRKLVTRWVVAAKKGETRARRLGKLIDACAQGTRLY
jgi:uncharacterized protein YdeI (YjbR/CyaY-like superfamily)